MWLKRSTMQTPSATRSGVKRCEFSVNRAVHVDREPQARSRLSARAALIPNRRRALATPHADASHSSAPPAALRFLILSVIVGPASSPEGGRLRAGRQERCSRATLPFPPITGASLVGSTRKPGSLSTRNFDRQVSYEYSCRRDPVSGERASSGATVGGP